MRIVGIDYGNARIGLAASDPGKILASPLKAIATKKNLRDTAAAILNEFAPYEPIETFVIGLPLLMNGKESPGSKIVRELALILEELSGKKVVLWDERLTTAQVERTLKEAEMRRKKRVLYIDAMAAGAILQSYLDSPRGRFQNSNSGANPPF
ncbi:MAG: Holliday junction resolvase RuvX [Verrucomicrobia bacterium]|nr:Holliday junction resolvase RuvX [Verrucomicrobiota bacterium]